MKQLDYITRNNLQVSKSGILKSPKNLVSEGDEINTMISPPKDEEAQAEFSNIQFTEMLSPAQLIEHHNNDLEEFTVEDESARKRKTIQENLS